MLSWRKSEQQLGPISKRATMSELAITPIPGSQPMHPRGASRFLALPNLMGTTMGIRPWQITVQASDNKRYAGQAQVAVD